VCVSQLLVVGETQNACASHLLVIGETQDDLWCTVGAGLHVRRQLVGGEAAAA